MALTGKQFTISAGDYEATVVEVGGGLRRFTYAGADVIASYNEDEVPPNAAGAVLVPWPNRLRGGTYTFAGQSYQVPITEVSRSNANHGLARWIRWAPMAVEGAAVTVAVDIPPQGGWPFELRVEVSYALHPEHGLAVTAVARNHGVGKAPFGMGFHPYLALHGGRLDDVTLRIPAERRLITDETLLPVGAQAVAGPYDLRQGRKLGAHRIDDAFTGLSIVDGRGVAEIRSASAATRLWFDETFGYLQVFTTEDVAHGVPAVAIEPMTCPADAFNSGTGLIVLDPGGMWGGSWGLAPVIG